MTKAKRILEWVFFAAIFLGAFLLFQVQPLIGKYILPWFGGSSAVWMTTVFFFQFVLLMGYGYCHVLSHVKAKVQGVIHFSMLAIILVLFACLQALWPSAITPAYVWSPSWTTVLPALHVLLILSISVGAPYFVLSTTSSLMQYWYSELHEGKSPYHFYGVSNFASMLALVSYPFIIEPYVSLIPQAHMWSLLYVIFVLLVMIISIVYIKHVHTVNDAYSTQTNQEKPHARLYMQWIINACIASTLLLAVTNQLTQCVANIPFVWILPLVIYLISFIFCFNTKCYYNSKFFALTTILLMLALFVMLYADFRISFLVQIVVYCLFLLSACIVCHGEVYALRPKPQYLTSFYLCLAIGGACGGFFVSLLAPFIFNAYWEFYISLLAILFMCVQIIEQNEKNSQVNHKNKKVLEPVFIVAGCAFIMIFFELIDDGNISRSRNFYGLLSVNKVQQEVYGDYYLMKHGKIGHGMQYRAPELRRIPTSYFTPESGIGVALLRHPKRSRQEPMRIGCIGLGVGTIATYGQKEDVIDFYEINPDVIRDAHSYFTYLEDSQANVTIYEGDGRLVLEKHLCTHKGGHYDIFILDAFSGGTIPVHLLTKEAFQLWLKHCDLQEGIIAVNIANKYLDLSPLIKAIAEEFHLEFVILEEEGDGIFSDDSVWGLLTYNKRFIENNFQIVKQREDIPSRSLWTDDFSNLFSVLK